MSRITLEAARSVTGAESAPANAESGTSTNGRRYAYATLSDVVGGDATVTLYAHVAGGKPEPIPGATLTVPAGSTEPLIVFVGTYAKVTAKVTAVVTSATVTLEADNQGPF